MSQDEVQVPELAGPPQEVDAAAAKARARGSVAPTADDVNGLRTRGAMSPADQRRGNPRATDLVFLPKLALIPGADHGNAGVTPRQVARENGMIAKASQIDGIAAGGLMNHLGARGGNQDERPVGIAAIGDLGGAVFHFEDNLRGRGGIAGEKGISKPARDHDGGFRGRRGKAATPGRRGRDRGRGGANHVDDDDRPSRPIPVHALR